MTTMHGGAVEWLWVSETGDLMTEEEIAGESGGTVSSRMVRGVRVLSGTGVIYGGTRSEHEPVASGMVVRRCLWRAGKRTGGERHRLSAPPAAGAWTDGSLGDASGLLASPPGLLATPPGL